MKQAEALGSLSPGSGASAMKPVLLGVLQK
jgi:hypothetical protein